MTLTTPTHRRVSLSRTAKPANDTQKRIITQHSMLPFLWSTIVPPPEVGRPALIIPQDLTEPLTDHREPLMAKQKAGRAPRRVRSSAKNRCFSHGGGSRCYSYGWPGGLINPCL
jgi:hypothetical protein